MAQRGRYSIIEFILEQEAKKDTNGAADGTIPHEAQDLAGSPGTDGRDVGSTDFVEDFPIQERGKAFPFDFRPFNSHCAGVDEVAEKDEPPRYVVLVFELIDTGRASVTARELEDDIGSESAAVDGLKDAFTSVGNASVIDK